MVCAWESCPAGKKGPETVHDGPVVAWSPFETVNSHNRDLFDSYDRPEDCLWLSDREVQSGAHFVLAKHTKVGIISVYMYTA